MQNKIIIITGGGKGFGKSLARSFAKRGAKIVVASNNEAELLSTAKEIGHDAFVCDVTKPEQLAELGAYAYKKYGAIDIWVNNVGIQIAPSNIEDVDLDKLHRLFDVNFFGYFYGCQVALKYMKKQKHGTIININSTAGLEGKPGISAYSASKFAIRGLTESLRKETADTKIKIFGVYPGGMQTEIYQGKYPDDFSKYMDPGEVAEKLVANLESQNPKEDVTIRRPTS